MCCYFAAVAVPSAHAMTQHQSATVTRELKRVVLPYRMEQSCNARALGALNKEHHDMKVDRVIAYGFGPVERSGTTITATGAVARSHEHWFHLSYECQTSEDGLEIESFDYTLGPEAPGWDMERLAD